MMIQRLCCIILLSGLSFAKVTKFKDGTDIFFKTNLKEMLNHPLKFEKPLQIWLKGTLIRNGFGRFEVGSRKFTSGLDAYSKLASWYFAGNGSAFFSTRMLYSKSYTEAVKTNDIAPFLLLDSTDPPLGRVKETEAIFNGMDNMNVNVIKLHDSTKGVDNYTVISDYWKMYEINLNTLETLRPIEPDVPDASKAQATVTLSSAHPLPELGTSNHLVFVSLPSVVPNAKSEIKIIRIKSAMDRELIANIEVDRVPYMHAFPVTKNYMILVGHPFYVDLVKTLETLRPLDSFKWEGDEITTLYVINLKTGKVQIMKTENTFMMHVVNAFEVNDNELFLDMITYSNPSSMHDFEMAVIHNQTVRAKFPVPKLKRYILNLQSEAVDVIEPQSLSGIPYANHFDFPIINENYRYGNYCYAYGVAVNVDFADFLHMALVKKDLCSGKRDKSWYTPYAYVNEPAFVARPGGQEEDDGILILPILDITRGQTNITIFDAKDLTMINSAPLPTNIPYGTHGKFFTDI